MARTSAQLAIKETTSIRPKRNEEGNFKKYEAFLLDEMSTIRLMLVFAMCGCYVFSCHVISETFEMSVSWNNSN